MSKTKKDAPALGADYSAKMKSSYAEKVKTSVKIYSKSDRRDNHIVKNMTEEAQQKSQKGSNCQGHCLCGAVSFNITGDLRQVVNCHCGQCLHTLGNYTGYSAIEKNKIQFVNDAGLKWYRSSNEARRGFCQECGASLFWERLGASTISIAAGMLDLAHGIKTIGHIYCSDKPEYYEIVDDLPKFPQSSAVELEGDNS